MHVQAPDAPRGEPAPPIDATTATGERFSLAEQAGTWVVLFFYPMANTPG